MNAIVKLEGVNKYFLHSHALVDLDLSIWEGETLGLIGHNGAGKSTLVNILTGTFHQTSGTMEVDGAQVAPSYDVYAANDLGIRAVFQELSLCPNLSVAENMRVFHPDLRGVGWQKRAASMILDTMDRIFPDHGVRANNIVESLTLGQRQMTEIGKAFSATDKALKLVILDEPTSALDQQTSQQLIDYVKSLHEQKVAVIYISHLLDEVLACADRIVVLRDGSKVGIVEAKETSRQKIIELMGEARPVRETGENSVAGHGKGAHSDGAELLVEPRANDGDHVRVRVRAGEIIGLAGLAGHGQTKLLLDLFDYRSNHEYNIKGPVTFVPGDRQTDGIFPVWSIAKNVTVSVYKKLKRLLLIDLKGERKIADKWKKIIDIKTDSVGRNVLSLSGGNQQKLLFARCLESDSRLVLMDDPTRGVDVGTKDEIYRLVIDESRKGRGFVWYTTEMDELQYCDRIYVFKAGKIVTELSGDQATEEDVLKSSF